jgi:glucokinase
VIAALRGRFGHASAERALSGPGIENLHHALCELAGETAAARSAADITAHGVAGTTRVASRCWTCSSASSAPSRATSRCRSAHAAGCTSAAASCRGWGDTIDRSRFRSCFENKGRFHAYLGEIPAFVVQATISPALTGAARALDDL